MANQIIIDIGAAANDGTGDPLRTAFNYVNNNFSNVWNTGLPNSNVQFSDNRILTVNTNANLVLAPNGIGKVASNVDIVPNTANVFSLGGATRRWNTVYGQYLNLSHNATIDGNLVVTGNITGGNINYTGNVFIGDLEGSVFDGASSIVLDVINSSIYVDNYYYANGTPVSFGGGGTPAGSNTQVQFNDNGAFGGAANFTFNKVTNILTVPGNLIPTGNTVANLGAFSNRWDTLYTKNITTNSVSGINVTLTGDLLANNVSVGNITSSDFIYANSATFYGDQYSDGAIFVGDPAGTVLGSDVVMQITANAGGYSQTNFQNINSGPTASGDYILTADNGNDSTHYLDMGITSSGWDGSETNVLSGLTPNNGYLYVQDGNLTLGTRAGNVSYSWKFDTTGNLTVAGNVIPTGNNTQSLGSATRQWNDLYLSNATIYMNSVPISLNSSNVMTVNGADVVTTASNGVTALGNVVFNGNVISTTGTNDLRINLSGENFIANTAGGGAIGLYSGNSQIDINNDSPGIEITSLNVNLTALAEGAIFLDASAANSVVDIESDGNTTITVNGNVWTFDTDSTLIFPGNAAANNASISSIENGSIVKLNSQANGYVGMTGFDSAGNNVAAITAVGLDGETDRVIISVYNPNIDDGEAWTFNNAGDFTTAGGNIFFGTQADDAVIVPGGNGVKIAADRSDITTGYVNVTTSGITIDALGSSASDITIRAGDDITLRGGDKVANPQQRGGDIFITPGNGGDDGGAGAGNGGYVEIVGGDGGLGVNDSAGNGGEVNLIGGLGGTGNIANAIAAGRGGTVVVIGGTGGDNLDDLTLNGSGGNVEIYGGQGSIDNANNRPGGTAGHVFLRGGNWGFNFVESGNVHIETYNGNDFLNWEFDNQGRTYFPGLSTARGDTTSGSLSGFTLRIGDGTNEAIITTPDGVDGSDSQRLVINPGAGSEFGEGGDIYLWAGRGGASGGSGGDIKIRGGQGMGGDGGDGGYIRMEAGDGATGSEGDSGAAGYIEITGGTSGVGKNGGYVRILGGEGNLNGGDANITGGTGVNGLGGNVNIISGTSGLGAGSCGDVNIWAGVTLPSPWKFDETGNLTLPPIATGGETGELARITGTRKIIGEPNTWSTFIDGHSDFGTVAWTASSTSIQSAKITFVVQSGGVAANWEQFDVSVCKFDGANAFVSVSGRVKQNVAIADTEVSAYDNEGGLEVWLNPAVGQTVAYVNYNAVEFNIMPD